MTDLDDGSKYGLGVEHSNAFGREAIGRHGAEGGAHTSAFYFPDDATAIVSIANQDGADPDALTRAALGALR
jgi:hypothetical protein